MSFRFMFFVFVFLLIFFSLSHLTLHKTCAIQRYVILIASVLFVLSYSGGITMIIVMVLMTISAYDFAILIGKNTESLRGKLLFISSVVIDLGVLLYFKYFKYTWEFIRNAIDSDGVTFSTLITPIGLSYFSLGLFSYLSDVYHGKIVPEKNFFDLLNYVLFFPALAEGPINLYKKLSPQLKENHFFDWDRCISGLQRILWGVFKKIVIADRIGIIVGGILKDDGAKGVIVFYAMVLYSFQIYADFSGGIDVIMGITEIMGIELTENFSQPFMAKSVTEFWNRWHKSLGDWMEKYVYYPIVLNKRLIKFTKMIKNKYLRKVFAATLGAVIVFVLVGIWHGTGWNYVVYGCYQAFFVSTATFLGPFYKSAKKRIRLDENCISWRVFTILRTFFILVFGRYFTRGGTLNNAIELFRRTFATTGIRHLFIGDIYNYGLDWKNVVLMNTCIIILLLVEFAHEKGFHFRLWLYKQDIMFRYVVYLVGLFAVIIFGIYGPEFEAASFIYAEF